MYGATKTLLIFIIVSVTLAEPLFFPRLSRYLTRRKQPVNRRYNYRSSNYYYRTPTTNHYYYRSRRPAASTSTETMEEALPHLRSQFLKNPWMQNLKRNTAEVLSTLTSLASPVLPPSSTRLTRRLNSNGWIRIRSWHHGWPKRTWIS